MDSDDHPLWKLLLDRGSTDTVKLSCTECFQLFEYDAGLLAEGGDLEEILPAIKQHFAVCSNCRETLKGWLEKMESELASREMEIIQRRNNSPKINGE